MNASAKLIKIKDRGVFIAERILNVTKKTPNSSGRRKVQVWCDGLNIYMSPVWCDNLDIDSFSLRELFCLFFLLEDCVYFLKNNDINSSVTFIYSLKYDNEIDNEITITIDLKELQDIVIIIELNNEVLRHRLINV